MANEKTRIGIIICDRYSDCAGGKCLRALHRREGAFSAYRDREIELVGYTSCGGCPGGNIEYAPAEMIRNGAQVIHLATGFGAEVHLLGKSLEPTHGKVLRKLKSWRTDLAERPESIAARRFPAPPERISISFGDGKVSGTVEGAHLDPIIGELRLPWPVASPETPPKRRPPAAIQVMSRALGAARVSVSPSAGAPWAWRRAGLKPAPSPRTRAAAAGASSTQSSSVNTPAAVQPATWRQPAARAAALMAGWGSWAKSALR